MCNVELEFNKLHLPKFDVPDGKDPFEYLRPCAMRDLKEFTEKTTGMRRK